MDSVNFFSFLISTYKREEIFTPFAMSLIRDHVDLFINQCLTKDLLYKIFHFVDLKDIKAIARVCKLWNELFKTSRFWEPFVRRKLADENMKDPVVFMQFSGRNLCYSFQWIFQKEKVDFTPDIEHKTWEGINRHRFYLDKNKKVILYYFIVCYGVYWCKFARQKGVTCMKIVKLTDPNVFHISSYQYDCDDGVTFISTDKMNAGPLLCKDILTYNYDEILLPNGAGKWTFPDGSTFEGSALDGMPHGKGKWNGTDEEVEFYHGERVKNGQKKRKIKWC